MSKINFLPPWVETNLQPAFYDIESGTCLQQTARMYNKVNELVRTANTQNEIIADYIEQFGELQDYVYDYFDNLDVQTEINNKLDKMAENGELYNSVLRFIQPTLDDLDTSITEVDNKVNALGNGSPAGVYETVTALTNADPDHSRIYVVSADGHWYYYDGENWADGGLYQSTVIADKGINILMLDDALQANFNVSFGNKFMPTDTDAGYYGVDSVTGKLKFTSDNSYASYSVDLVAGKVYCFTGFNYGAVVGLVIADSDDNVIFSTKESPVVYSNTGASYIFNVKENGIKAYISPVTTGAVPLKSMVMLREVVSIDNNLKLNNSLTTVNTFTSYVLNNSTSVGSLVTFTNSDDYTTVVYAVSKGVTYKVKGKNYGINRSVIFTNLDNEAVYYNNNSSSEAYSYEYTAEYDGFVYVSNYSNTALLNGSVEVSLTNIMIETPSPLRNKKIVYDGDSICESRISGNSANGGAYAKIIADIVDGTYTNQAVGGGTLSYVDAQDSHSVVHNLSNLPVDGDIYCFEGGLNDWWGDRQLGTFDATDYSSTPDETTITGAMEKIFRYALTNFLGKPVVFVIIHKITNPYNTHAGVTFAQVRERMIAVCEKYGIPYFDAWKSSGLNGMITAQKNAYLNANQDQTPDGTHPNKAGYEKFYVPQLLALLESVIEK